MPTGKPKKERSGGYRDQSSSSDSDSSDSEQEEPSEAMACYPGAGTHFPAGGYGGFVDPLGGRIGSCTTEDVVTLKNENASVSVKTTETFERDDAGIVTRAFSAACTLGDQDGECTVTETGKKTYPAYHGQAFICPPNEGGMAPPVSTAGAGFNYGVHQQAGHVPPQLPQMAPGVYPPQQQLMAPQPQPGVYPPQQVPQSDYGQHQVDGYALQPDGRWVPFVNPPQLHPNPAVRYR